MQEFSAALKTLITLTDSTLVAWEEPYACHDPVVFEVFHSRVCTPWSLAKARIFNDKTRDQRVFAIKNFLPDETFKELQQLALDNRHLFFRKSGFNCSGAALGRHELLDSTCAGVVEGLINDAFLAKVRADRYRRPSLRHSRGPQPD